MSWIIGPVVSVILLAICAILFALGAFRITIPGILSAIQSRPRGDWELERRQPKPDPAEVVVHKIAAKRIEYREQKRKIEEEKAIAAQIDAPKKEVDSRQSRVSHLIRQIAGDVETPVAAAGVAIIDADEEDITAPEIETPIEEPIADEKSVIDEESLDFAKKMIEMYPEKIVLPTDVNAFVEFNNDAENRYVSVNELNENEMGLDIGPNTIDKFNNILSSAKIVFWNGPLGVYEFEKCTEGSKKILEHLVNNNIPTILGGGDIVAAATDLGYKEKVTHASTGGGATLEYMEGKDLPGLSCIPERD
jgi:hypothetical protein